MEHDFGHPTSVQLPDGSMVTVRYKVIYGTKIAAIRPAHWRLV
ncbi:MAG: hypothetical protein ACOX6D_04210 [Thermoguttaceae bacterium]|jgi:hypothetical protein